MFVSNYIGVNETSRGNHSDFLISIWDESLITLPWGWWCCEGAVGAPASASLVPRFAQFILSLLQNSSITKITSCDIFLSN